MKPSLLILAFICLSMCSIAQNTPVMLKIKAARAAYAKHQFQQTLDYLKDAEKLDKKNNLQILYLKIMAQRALLPGVDDPAFYNHMEQFDKLEELREHCKHYLDYPVPAKISEAAHHKIFAVQKSLNPYPVAKVQFDEIMHLRNSGKQH